MSPPPTEDFANLVAQVRRGDADALRRLVEQYEPEIRRVAHVRLGPALRPYLDSMDLVQSVHKSLIDGLRQNRYDLSSPEKLVALAATMIRRKIAAHWRRPAASRPVHAGAPGVAETLVSLCGSADDPARAAQVRDTVQHVLGQLNDMERRLLELRLLNYSTAEAAAKMGLEPGYLRVCLHRLRQRFRAKDLPLEWI
jgi:RNA polymerase sigma-70 factor (ECF subfamily)